MKLIVAAAAFATLIGGVASSANAHPHHRQCKWVMEHHHRVKHCW
jgi:hypothetical protein